MACLGDLETYVEHMLEDDGMKAVIQKHKENHKKNMFFDIAGTILRPSSALLRPSGGLLLRPGSILGPSLGFSMPS